MVGTGFIARAALVATLLGGVALFGVSQMAGAAEGDGQGQFDPYLHRTTGGLADPVNLVFRGTLDQAATNIVQVLGWQPVDGSQMLFLDHGAHFGTARQFGLDLGNGSRYHIRLEGVQTGDGQNYVLSGVHRDDTEACGHVGRAFSLARDVVGKAFEGSGFPVHQIALHNSLPGRQCDGSFTFGDGTADVIDLTSQPGAGPTAIRHARRIHLPLGFSIPLPRMPFLNSCGSAMGKCG
jgi:hypothetical protein